MLNFKKEATKKLNEIGILDLLYSRVDGKPMFKNDINKIDTLKKYFIIELIPILEDHTSVFYNSSSKTINYRKFETLLKVEDFTTNFKRILKINKLNENR